MEIDEQIYQLSTLVAGDFSLQEVLDKLAEAAVKIIGAKACSIRLLDEEKNDLRSGAPTGSAKSTAAKDGHEGRRGHQGRVCRPGHRDRRHARRRPNPV
jgi:GAF domain-containing protein